MRNDYVGNPAPRLLLTTSEDLFDPLWREQPRLPEQIGQAMCYGCRGHMTTLCGARDRLNLCLALP